MHPLQIDKIGTSRLGHVSLPPCVQFSVFQHCVDVAKRLSTYEAKATGCILVLADAANLPAYRRLSTTSSSLCHKKITDHQHEGSLQEAFAADGGILIDGRSGEILETKVKFTTGVTEFNLVLDGYGTRHHEALDVACGARCVAITRSQDGHVTVFSSEHIQTSPDKARCFRVHDEPDENWQLTVVMQRIALVRFDDNGKMDFLMQASDALRSLKAPLQVVAFVGPGRTGKSTLAGSVVGNSSLFPAPDVLDAVTQGIDAVAVQNPRNNGTLLVLDSEGFDNVLAKSRPEVATLCLLLCSQIVCVDYDRLDDRQMTSLARLSACREVLMPSGAAAANNLDPQPPELVVVVNGSRFHGQYAVQGSEIFEKALSSDEENAERNACREAVRKHFPRRYFASLPISAAKDLDMHIRPLQHLVLQAPPLRTADIGVLEDYEPAYFDGNMFHDLLRRSVELINNGDCIRPRDVYQSILHDREERCIQQALSIYQSQLPVDGPYRPKLSYQPHAAMQAVNAACLTTEARERLEKVLRAYYDEVERANHEKGQAETGECWEEIQAVPHKTWFEPARESQWLQLAIKCVLAAVSASVPGYKCTALYLLLAAAVVRASGGELQNLKIEVYEVKKRTVRPRVNGDEVRGEWVHVRYGRTAELVDSAPPASRL
ncbi:GBP6 [Symbiodinium sp. CCMP2592]|nr:GBP6 [Symbiodinium sp. CCMP2592]